ncbi:MAG: ABC transporter ATP-binding protein [Dongiaceae bacterium]
MSETLLEARGVKRVLPGTVPVTLVQGIDLRVDAGDFLAITGPSGSGKSSLLYLLGLLDEPTEGEIALMGHETAGLSRTARARLRLSSLGFIFQFHFLLPEFTAMGNVLIPMRKLNALSEKEMHKRAEEILVGLGLQDCLKKTPDKMSGGERQRAAIARALANNPHLIFADEPTGNLDSKNARTVFEIFSRLAQQDRRAVVVVTHDLDLAAQATRRVHLVDGRIVSDQSQQSVAADQAVH